MWAGDTAPPEYLTLLLCRDIYHCTPSQLANENAAEILVHLTCIDMEGQVEKEKKKGKSFGK